MIRITPAIRISLGLVFIALSVLLLGNFIGLIPDESLMTMETRKSVAESLAVQCTLAARNNNIAAVKKTMDVIVELHPEVLSLGLRNTYGRYVAQTEEHQSHWIGPQEKESTSTHWQLPLYRNDRQWGMLEITFTPQGRGLVLGYRLNPFTLLLALFALFCFSGFLIYMRRVLRDLDPTTVMPKRVKYALDTLTEGVIIVDTKERIVLANAAFAEKLGCTVKALMGLKASQLDWVDPETNKPHTTLPWIDAVSQREVKAGIPINLYTKIHGVLTFTVNCAPIIDDKGRSRGALATFADVTALKKKNSELSEMLNLLQNSNEKIERQNKELEILATQDSLTGCLNRRAFFEKAEKYMATANAEGKKLACLMVDIDLFKSINDNYGHAVGDRVIQYVAMTLQAIVRGDDAVCRYGGEEFCLLLQDCDIKNASLIAERVRKKIEHNCVDAVSLKQDVSISASFGISELSLGAGNVEELCTQADSALYRAKQSGRNRVVSWDSIKESDGPQKAENTRQTSSIKS